MSSLTIALCLLLFVYDSSAIDIMPELKRNILNFGYEVNFKYEGILSHSFDWFYIVMKFELPKTKGLRLVTFKFDSSNVVMLAIQVLTQIMQNF